MASITSARIGTLVAFCLLALAPAAWSQERTVRFCEERKCNVGASTVPNFTFDGVTFDGTS